MKTSILFLGILASTLCLSAGDGSVDGKAVSGPAVLEVGGTKLTLADFERARPTALFQARNTFYETQKRALETYADELLLEQQAKKEGVTVAQLLERHVTSVLPKDPADESLRVYYEGIDTTESFEAVRDRILDAIRQRRAAKVRAAYVASLRSQANIAVRLAPPRVQVPLDKTPIRGSRNAPVTFIEYADYECPYCQQIQPLLDKLRTEYKDRLAFVYKDMPLPMHGSAQKAAEAAHCAGAQGRYWEFHDEIVVGKPLAVANLKEVALGLKLDGDRFNKCLDSGEQAEVVKSSMVEAQGLGIQGTPSYLINGRFFSGMLTYERLRGIIEEELAGSRVAQAAAAR
jgi:protein-disulfide isomerase